MKPHSPPHPHYLYMLWQDVRQTHGEPCACVMKLVKLIEYQWKHNENIKMKYIFLSETQNYNVNLENSATNAISFVKIYLFLWQQHPKRMEYLHIRLILHDDNIKLKIFSVSLALCVVNTLVTGEFPSQRDSKLDFDVSLMLVHITC